MKMKAVNVRMPMQLYDRVKSLADKEYISVSGFIFNVLDKAIYQNGVRRVEVIETKSDRRRVSQIVQGVLSDHHGDALDAESNDGGA